MFYYNTTSFQLVHVASNQCTDLDSSDSRLELYGCNVPVSPNQQWLFNSSETLRPADSNTRCATSCRGVKPGVVGSLSSVEMLADNHVRLRTDNSLDVHVVFYAQDVFRVFLSPYSGYSEATELGIVQATNSFDRPLVGCSRHATLSCQPG